VEVFCPGFVSDCLETLEEIAMEARQSFLGAGGQDFRYISCVNDFPGFIDALADLVRQHGHGWLVDPVEAEAADTAEPSSAAEARTRRLERARALGADR
jgi:ferrochelatase